jgi:hypothetical protein
VCSDKKYCDVTLGLKNGSVSDTIRAIGLLYKLIQERIDKEKEIESKGRINKDERIYLNDGEAERIILRKVYRSHSATSYLSNVDRFSFKNFRWQKKYGWLLFGPLELIISGKDKDRKDDKIVLEINVIREKDAEDK